MYEETKGDNGQLRVMRRVVSLGNTTLLHPFCFYSSSIVVLCPTKKNMKDGALYEKCAIFDLFFQAMRER